jgi:hypothetical protein
MAIARSRRDLGSEIGRSAVGALMTSAALIAQAGVANAIPCPATASVEGPAKVTREVASTLRSHGIAVGQPGACAGQRAVKVRLTPDGTAGGYKLHIEDSFGRTSDRVVTEPAMAASLIESWAVDEDADLLTVPGPPTAPATLGVVGTATTPETVSRFHAWGGVTSVLGSEGSLWAGGALDACARWGRFCVGGQGRVLRDTGVIGPTSDGSAMRTAADLLLIGALPTTFGRLLLIPSLGVGAGWLRNNVPDEGEGGPTVIDTVGFRAEAALLTGVVVSKRVALAFELGATLAPGARPESNMDQGAAVNVPAEPGAYFHAGLACVISP